MSSTLYNVLVLSSLCCMCSVYSMPSDPMLTGEAAATSQTTAMTQSGNTTTSAETTEATPVQNVNPLPPSSLRAHAFYYAGGTVNISTGPNPFANNVIDGRDFLENEMNFTEREIAMEKELACAFWLKRFGLNCTQIETDGLGSVVEYQLSPNVYERLYLLTSTCPTPPGGHIVLDGGFQLFITSDQGAFGMLNGSSIYYPKDTNLVYSWLRVQLKEPEDMCDPTLSDWLVFPYRSTSVAKWTTNAIVFELEITTHADNPYGHGSLLGISSPVLDFDAFTITNRLFNYISFDNLP